MRLLKSRPVLVVLGAVGAAIAVAVWALAASWCVTHNARVYGIAFVICVAIVARAFVRSGAFR
jgi:hypothetical protein